MDLIGIPHRLVLSDKGLAKGAVEYKGRRGKKSRGQISFVSNIRENCDLALVLLVFAPWK